MKKFLKKLKITNENSFKDLMIQFIKFGIVGFFNTFISLSTYYVLTFFNFNYIIANAIGFFLSIINSFIWNRKFVFKTGGKSAFIKTFISYGFTFLLTTFLLYLMVDVIGISQNIAPLINMIISIPLNFILNKFWAFKEKTK